MSYYNINFCERISDAISKFQQEHSESAELQSILERNTLENLIIKKFFDKIHEIYDSAGEVSHEGEYAQKFRNWDKQGRVIGDIHIQDMSFSCAFKLDEFYPSPRPAISISFSNCQFKEGLFFDNITGAVKDKLEENIEPRDIIHLYNCRTGFLSIKNSAIDTLLIGDSEIKKLEFINSIISHGGARFFDTSISEYLYITNCEFHPKLEFSGMKQIQHLHIKETFCESFILYLSNFPKNTGYRGSFFDLTSISSDEEDYSLIHHRNWGLILKDVEISNDADFNYTEFHSGVLIEDSTFISSAKFYGCKFKEQTTFKNVEFWSSPKFHDAELCQDTDFTTARFYDVKSAGAWRDYRTLKAKMEQFGSDHEVYRFHSYELEARYNTVLPNWSQIHHEDYIEKVSSFFFRIFTNYNRNLWLPVIWLIVSFSIGTLTYSLTNAVGCNFKDFGPPINDTWIVKACSKNYIPPLLLSLQQTLGPFGLILNKDILELKFLWAKFFSVFQILFSTLMIFLLIFGVRRKFKI